MLWVPHRALSRKATDVAATILVSRVCARIYMMNRSDLVFVLKVYAWLQGLGKHVILTMATCTRETCMTGLGTSHGRAVIIWGHNKPCMYGGCRRGMA